MILPARRRIGGEELCHGSSETEVAHPGGDQAPDDGRGPAAGESERQAGSQGGPRIQDCERKTQHGKRGEVPMEFGLVAQMCELRIIGHGAVSTRTPLHDRSEEDLLVAQVKRKNRKSAAKERGRGGEDKGERGSVCDAKEEVRTRN